LRGEIKRWIRLREDDGESVLDHAGLQDGKVSSLSDTSRPFGRIQGRPHGAEDARHISGCPRDCLKSATSCPLALQMPSDQKERRVTILHTELHTELTSSPASSILYAPLQVCIQHTNILGHSLHLTMMHTCLFSFHRNHSPSTRSLVSLCKTCNILHVTEKKKR